MNNKGFTIVEVLISLMIITVGMLAVLVLFSQNVHARAYTKNKLIASMLAQEGVELVRNIRDQNWKDAQPWNTGSGAGNADDILQDLDFTVDYVNGVIDIGGIANAQLYINSDGFYEHTVTATSTPFYRLMVVSLHDLDGGGDDAIKLTSTVRWDQGNNTHDYVVTTMLFDWK